MSPGARAYFIAVLGSGIALLAVNLPALRPPDVFRFTAYFILAVLAACLKVPLPGIRGTMSVLFLFLLVSVIELSLPEALIIAAISSVVQSFWHARERPKFVHLTFNIAALVIATGSAWYAHVAPIWDLLNIPWALKILLTTVVFFVANTLTVAVIIGLTERKSIVETWRSCYFWSFPYYLAGACVFGILGSLGRLAGWQPVVLSVPIVYLLYRSYRIYLDRLEESRIHAEELKAAALRLESVLESTTDCVFAVSSDDRIVYANQRARSRLFRDSEPIGCLLREAFPKLADGGFREDIESLLNNPTGNPPERFFPDLGAWFEMHAFRSSDGVAFYLKEVTEKRELSEQLRQSQKMEAVGRLAGGVAHDFNNLLTIILGYGQIAADLLEEDHSAQSSIREVIVAGERAAALTQRLLAFSRKQILEPEVLDLNTVVQGMETMLNRLIGEDITIHTDLSPNPGLIRADHHQLEQVIMNLAVNARDAMPGGGQLTISTGETLVEAAKALAHGRDQGRYSVLSIKDTGFGMSTETLAKIFEPFFTTKEIGKGTGLGLPMVYGTIQQSGGFLTVRSEVGVGSEFEVFLPCVVGAPESKALERAQGSVEGSWRILLIEDDRPVRELTESFLTQAGYSVMALDVPARALGLSASDISDFDLLVTDMVMPGVSGPDVAEKLLSLRPQMKVIYVSGYTDHPLLTTDKHQAERAIWLQKPFTRDELLVKVRSALLDPPN